VTQSDNGITNAIEMVDSLRLGRALIAANNDRMVRIYDLHTWAPKGRLEYEWAVNYATLHPYYGSLLAVVGDDLTTHLTDALSGATIAKLQVCWCACWALHERYRVSDIATVCIWSETAPRQKSGFGSGYYSIQGLFYVQETSARGQHFVKHMVCELLGL
jgi:hypothetical protein